MQSSHLRETGTAEPYNGERVDLHTQPSNPNMIPAGEYSAIMAGKEVVNQAYITNGINAAESYANTHASNEIPNSVLENMIIEVSNYLESVRKAELG